MVWTEGEGGKRMNTNCGDSDFVVSLEKKRFSFAFSHSVFFYYYLILLLCYYRFITILFTV